MLYIARFAEDWRFYSALSLGVIFSICLHEFCHALAALRQGDPTAADRGHLTLNPLKQMGWWSLVMFALVGIAWGRVPVNPARMRRAWSPAWVAAAGPLANFLLFLLFSIGTALVWCLMPEQRFAVSVLLHIAVMNMVLFILNFLPLPGLDGWTVLGYFAPRLTQANSELVNGSFLVLLLLLFSGFRYVVMAGSFCTLKVVEFWLMLGGGA